MNGTGSSWKERAEHLRQELGRRDYYLTFEDAVTVAAWWHLRDGALIAEGEPGSGKTALILKVAEAYRVPPESVYVIRCYKSVGARETLYEIVDGELRPRKVIWALEDPHPDTVLFWDDVDKIPKDEAYEGVIDEVIQEQSVTVNEMRRTIRRKGPTLHMALTSNAGVIDASPLETLSQPLLRRGPYIKLLVPEGGRAENILRALVPALPHNVVAEAVRFVEVANKSANLNKRISISEVIQWARMLDFMTVTELDEEAVRYTLSRLAKGADDQANLRKATERILRVARSGHMISHLMLNQATLKRC